MTTITILFIWQVLAAERYSVHTGWVNVGEFSSPAACEEAKRLLAVPTARCVPE
jgi:hypothetical protein